MRENDIYLPGFQLPPNVTVTTEFGEALEDADVVLGVMPSHHAADHVHGDSASSCAVHAHRQRHQGHRRGQPAALSEVIHAGCWKAVRAPVASLSGPTFAREVARGEPAAVVIASPDLGLAKTIQAAFSGPTLRLYTNADLVGVELGAALKNVIAIGAGVCHGLGLGNNTMAALITRGLAEITRLAVAMGAEPRTLAGLAGLGDLVLTCTGDLSRNRPWVSSSRAVTSWRRSSAPPTWSPRASAPLMRLWNWPQTEVEMPIAGQMFEMLRHGKPPREAIRELMERSLKGE